MRCFGLASLLLLLFTTFGCGGSDPVIGTWLGKLSMVQDDNATVTLNLRSGNRFDVKVSGMPNADTEGDYRVEGNKILLTVTKAGGMDVPRSAQNTEQAFLSEDGKSIDYKRGNFVKQ